MDNIRLDNLDFKVGIKDSNKICFIIIFSSKRISKIETYYYISGVLGENTEQYLLKFNSTYIVESYRKYIDEQDQINQQVNVCINHLKEIILFIYKYLFVDEVTSFD